MFQREGKGKVKLSPRRTSHPHDPGVNRHVIASTEEGPHARGNTQKTLSSCESQMGRRILLSVRVSWCVSVASCLL